MREKILAAIEYILAKGDATFTGPITRAVWVGFATVISRHQDEIASVAASMGGDVIAGTVKVGNDAVAAWKTPRIMGVELDDWLWMALVRPWLQSLVGVDPELNRLVALVRNEATAHE